MYEARQNKEKVSRQIDVVGDMARRRNTIKQYDKFNSVHNFKSIQRTTKISYSTITFNSQNKNGKNHQTTVGKEMDAHLDPNDRIYGSKTGDDSVQKDLMKDLNSIIPSSQISGGKFIRGHLLNYDLGGLAVAYNLFPIPFSYNTTIHSRYIEQPVKSWLGNNEYVHYKVVANDISNIRNPNEYKFKWAAVHASQEDLLPTLPDLEEKDYQSEMITPARNIWAIKDNRKELPNDNKTETTLSKTFIDDETYNYGTISTTNYYKG